MKRSESIKELVDLLRSFLDGKDAEWEQQSADPSRRRPTLPVTKEGKINVRGLVRELQILGLDRGVDVRQSAFQYFYDRSELADEVNVIARVQGVREIGSRSTAQLSKAGSDGKLARANAELKRQSEGHLVSNARVQALEQELAVAKAEIRRLQARIDFARSTGIMPRVTDVIE
jgi:hypothetical protein